MINKALTQVTASELKSFELFLSYMPQIDDFLTSIGETIEVYNQMLIDDEIGSCLELRKRLILSYKPQLSIKEGNEKIRDFVDEILKTIPFIKILEQALTALEFGYSIQELVWHDPKEKEGKWIPKDSILLKPERFAFTIEGALYMLTPQAKLLDTKYKFIIHKIGISPENPYGVSILRRCYWPWQFKKAGWRFWLIAAEKFGVPSIVAIFATQNEQEAEKRAKMLADMLMNLKTDAAAAVANIEDLKVIETKGTALSSFEKLIEMCNRAINKAITGQILASSEARHGTKAQAQVHENILYEITKSDAQALASTINQFIRWIVELNFGKDTLAPVLSFDFTRKPDWEKIKDAIDRGIPLSKKALYSIYNLPKPQDEEDIFITPKLSDIGFSEKHFGEENDFFVFPRQHPFRLIW